MNLKEIFDNTNNWLKFAEAKHAVLIGFLGAGLWGILNLVEYPCSWNIFFKIYLIWSVSMFVISSIISLISFFPILYPLRRTKVSNKKNLNPIYFKDLASMEPKELINQMNLNNYASGNINLKLAEQIIINSRIALYKHKLFIVAMWFILLGLIPPITILTLIFLKIKKS